MSSYTYVDIAESILSFVLIAIAFLLQFPRYKCTQVDKERKREREIEYERERGKERERGREREGERGKK
jgi:hypothetical protein